MIATFHRQKYTDDQRKMDDRSLKMRCTVALVETECGVVSRLHELGRAWVVELV